MPRPLLSEALRGHGALIRDSHGDRFVDELSPRDVVCRAMTQRMLDQGVAHLWLDATGLEHFNGRFPTIAASLRANGLDPGRDWLPIAPAAHYLCGGVVTDLDGATALPGLWACGEVACTGVHGANRLASNSLLEGMVFAPRVIEAIERGKEGAEPTGAMRSVIASDHGEEMVGGQRLAGEEWCNAYGLSPHRPETLRQELQQVMTHGAGVVRSRDSLETTEAKVHDLLHALPDEPSVVVHEGRNLLTVGHSLVRAALARAESRGCHWRTDYPEPDPDLRLRLVQAP